MFNRVTVKIKNWGALPFLLMLFCLQFHCKKAQPPLQISDILTNISPESLSLDLADQALPRLSEGLILLRMRGGDTDIIKSSVLEQENNLRKCLLVGAYLSAAQWDWEQFMRRRFLRHAKTPEEYKELKKEVNQLKFAMEQHLTNISHRLSFVEAPAVLVQVVDQLKKKFAASESTIHDDQIKEISDSLAVIAKEIEAFILTENDYSMHFAFGQWLVWQAELSNLCRIANVKDFACIRDAMNRLYRQIDLKEYKSIAATVLGDNERAMAKGLSSALANVDHSFAIEMQNRCEDVRNSIDQIFDLFKLEFAGLRSFI